MTYKEFIRKSDNVRRKKRYNITIRIIRFV